ncbi:hypothetical protein HMPREF9533_02174 [Escherichia coli MS 60-1]|nr:hypothetical protein HMPREF9553_03482 [Escherichia coli MS 200-1]EGB82996.1 hypothetical protein HMPREF9533_02174 [Escherichia coli MS 60-1]ESE36648.1 hypothetical protein HMPREF1622_01390 [Escherichia coli A35218R]
MRLIIVGLIVAPQRRNTQQEITMKIFQRYNPLQVAKYVKILFRGRLYIKDVGAFEFDKGKILIPKVKDKLHLSVMSEVNRQVMRLQTEMA